MEFKHSSVICSHGMGRRGAGERRQQEHGRCVCEAFQKGELKQQPWCHVLHQTLLLLLLLLLMLLLLLGAQVTTVHGL